MPKGKKKGRKRGDNEPSEEKPVQPSPEDRSDLRSTTDTVQLTPISVVVDSSGQVIEDDSDHDMDPAPTSAASIETPESYKSGESPDSLRTEPTTTPSTEERQVRAKQESAIVDNFEFDDFDEAPEDNIKQNTDLPRNFHMSIFLLLVASQASNSFFQSFIHAKKLEFQPFGLLTIQSGAEVFLSAIVLLCCSWRKLFQSSSWAFSVPRFKGLLSWMAIWVPPAFLNVATMLVSIYAMSHMTEATYTVFYSTHIFFSSLLWSMAFSFKFCYRRWSMIALLFVGTVLSGVETANLKLSVAVMIVLASAFCIAMEAVWLEFHLKAHPQEHITSAMICYFAVVGSVALLANLLYAGPALFTSSFLQGVSDWRVIAMLISACVMDFSKFLILKHVNTIAKVFASSLSVPPLVIASLIVLGRSVSMVTIFGFSLILLSVLGFYVFPHAESVSPKSSQTSNLSPHGNRRDKYEPVIREEVLADEWM